MSSGRAHSRATRILALPAAWLASQVLPGDPLANGAAAAVGCLCGLVLEPDLDVDGITRSEWRVIRRLWVFGMLWVCFWWPYALLIPHRSPLSHFPVMGTVGRLLYLVGMAAVLTAVFDWPTAWLYQLPEVIRSPFFMPWLFGLVLSDTGHYVMDRVSTRLGLARKARRARRIWGR